MCRILRSRVTVNHTTAVDTDIPSVPNTHICMSDDVSSAEERVTMLPPKTRARRHYLITSRPCFDAEMEIEEKNMNYQVDLGLQHPLQHQFHSLKRHFSCFKRNGSNCVTLSTRKRVRFASCSFCPSPKELVSLSCSVSAKLSLPSLPLRPPLSILPSPTELKTSLAGRTLGGRHSEEVPPKSMDDDSCDCRTKINVEVMEYRPLCSEISHEEKTARWIQPSDHRQSRENANLEARNAQVHDHSKLFFSQLNASFCSSSPSSSSLCFPSFVETYAAIYQLCHESNNPLFNGKGNDMSRDEVSTCESSLIASRLSPVMMSTLVYASDFSRGLEDRILPHLAIQRRLTRLESIRMICLSHKLLIKQQKEQTLASASSATSTSSLSIPTEHHAVDDIVALLAQTLSLPARMFGESYGAVDALSAMLEYSH